MKQTINWGKKTIFIEPENKNIELPIYFDPSRHRLILKGQFYVYPDYPKGTPETEEPLKKAKVFRYSEMKIIDIPKSFSKKEEKTFILNYDPIACECAKWFQSKYSENLNEREYFYLERKSENLPNADSLYN
ncbi:hypothetical protein [Chryseobacterium mulctrae]|uniref:hypothetical protein n=1 Tax=Chryseobacterium mulctrae TaxID=2576777 RepID=UPI0013905E7D|nr:hypothetical protein [Chryseobacterium mulctrae]